MTTTDSDDEAQRLARGLVETRLAACVQIVGPVRSVFRWEGAVQVEPEYQLVVKTTRAAEATEWIVGNHSYDVPEVITLPIDGGHETYLTWMADESSG
jgi:periplasmic divalent cation tolerance protein